MAEETTTTKTNHQCGDDSNATFTSSQGQLLVGEQKYTLRVLKMNGATMVFLSATEPECLDEMAVAMRMPQDGQVVGTTMLGPQSITESQRMAEQLSKRFGRQFFVSYNVQVDRMMAPLLEKQFSLYVGNNREQFI